MFDKIGNFESSFTKMSSSNEQSHDPIYPIPAGSGTTADNLVKANVSRSITALNDLEAATNDNISYWKAFCGNPQLIDAFLCLIVSRHYNRNLKLLTMLDDLLAESLDLGKWKVSNVEIVDVNKTWNPFWVKVKALDFEVKQRQAFIQDVQIKAAQPLTIRPPRLNDRPCSCLKCSYLTWSYISAFNPGRSVDDFPTQRLNHHLQTLSDEVRARIELNYQTLGDPGWPQPTLAMDTERRRLRDLEPVPFWFSETYPRAEEGDPEVQQLWAVNQRRLSAQQHEYMANLDEYPISAPAPISAYNIQQQRPVNGEQVWDSGAEWPRQQVSVNLEELSANDRRSSARPGLDLMALAEEGRMLG
ncbi:MAG: hypothetical protein M1812_005760 [Candelaria pacifica]|nr:MAG: hypothetical protein M1812_005760 [Candelaria pacifica]